MPKRVVYSHLDLPMFQPTHACLETLCFAMMARVGFEPTASSGLSQSGLPVAYRAAAKLTK